MLPVSQGELGPSKAGGPGKEADHIFAIREAFSCFLLSASREKVP
jgi:hypothetical protein